MDTTRETHAVVRTIRWQGGSREPNRQGWVSVQPYWEDCMNSWPARRP